MKDVSANKFYFFSKKYIKEIIESEFTDNWIVKYQNKVVAATITIRSDKSKIAEYHLSANNLMGKKNKASSFMIHELASYYRDKKYDKLYLGGGRTSEKNDTLFFFKRGFSSRKKTFFIGYRIFDHEKYNFIKKKNKKKFNNNKILF